MWLAGLSSLTLFVFCFSFYLLLGIFSPIISWPFLLAVWGILNFALLSGTKPFFHHWLYWQDYIDLFNENNPSGEVVSSVWHHRVVAISLSLGCIVSVKRFWLGLHLGRQTFCKNALLSRYLIFRNFIC